MQQQKKKSGVHQTRTTYPPIGSSIFPYLSPTIHAALIFRALNILQRKVLSLNNLPKPKVYGEMLLGQPGWAHEWQASQPRIMAPRYPPAETLRPLPGEDLA